jgi:hypothetical protein
MDGSRLDALSRSLDTGPSRRGLSRRLGELTLGGTLALLGLTGSAAKRKKNKNLTFNEFGCVPVGGRCRGKNSVCCSGICQGKKPKQGERDKTHCVAHDATSCLAGQTVKVCGGSSVLCTTSTGEAGGCLTTTGNAGYCAAAIDCILPSCAKDADCQAHCGPQWACVLCPIVALCESEGYPADRAITRCVGPSQGVCSGPP